MLESFPTSLNVPSSFLNLGRSMLMTCRVASLRLQKRSGNESDRAVSLNWRLITFARCSQPPTETRPCAPEFSESAERICTRRSRGTDLGSKQPMRFRIIWPGKTRDARLRALIDDYFGRLSHFFRCELTELRESGRADKTGIDKDTRSISDALRPGAVTVLLDPEGAEWSSLQLADQVRTWEGSGIKEVAFVIV